MQYEGPGPEIDEIIREVEKWYMDEIFPEYQVADAKRKGAKWPALMECHKKVIHAIASCKKNYENKLDEAKHELAKQEMKHPLYDQVEKQGDNIGKLMTFHKRYKSELQRVVNPEEFERIRDEIEGPYDLQKEIRKLKWDMGLLLQQLKAADPKNSPLGPKI